MTGYPDYNYSLFNAVASSLRDQGHDVANPAYVASRELSEFNSETPYKLWLKRALLMQLECDAWAGLPGWTNSKGAKIEFDIAVACEQRLYLVRPKVGDDFIRVEPFS